MMKAESVVTLVLRLVHPALRAKSVLLVVHPVAKVHFAVEMDVPPQTIRLVVDPVSLVYVAVLVRQLAEAVGFVISPGALIFGAARPDLHAVAIFRIAEPLALIRCTRCKDIRRPMFPLQFLLLLLFLTIPLLITLLMRCKRKIVVTAVLLVGLVQDSLALQVRSDASLDRYGGLNLPHGVLVLDLLLICRLVHLVERVIRCWHVVLLDVVRVNFVLRCLSEATERKFFEIVRQVCSEVSLTHHGRVAFEAQTQRRAHIVVFGVDDITQIQPLNHFLALSLRICARWTFYVQF